VANPVILAVDEGPEPLGRLERELRARYDRQYRIESAGCADDARAVLERLVASGDEVALVISGLRLPDCSGSELLETARQLHPNARRALLIDFAEQGEPAIGEAIFSDIARGRVDHYLIRPATSPDEFFMHEVSGLLLEWTDGQREAPNTIVVVGDSWSGRAYELRETLGRCAMPHTFCLADSEQGRALVEQAPKGSKLPLVAFPDGSFLVDPTNAELAVASGGPAHPEHMDFDLLIVGAGPAGLSAAVYAASEGFSTLVVDEGGIGGQATSSSLIRNFLGFPRGVSGRRLAQSAYQQAWVFGAQFAFMTRVNELRHEDGQLSLALADSEPVKARAVLLACGVTYRRIGIPELERLNGAGVFYGSATSEAQGLAGRDAFVLGGANSAGQAALHLARYARRVTLVVRADTLEKGMSHYLVQQVRAAANIDVRLGTEVVGGSGDDRLERLVLRDPGGVEEELAAEALFVMIGAQPHTEWLPPGVRRDERGYVLTGTDVGDDFPLDRAPLLFETSMPGVFAAGDVRHGSVKRVASAVGEGSVAIQLLHQLFEAEARYPLGRPPVSEVALAPNAS
jgi:thioredoxin reductase (NADPH)